MARLMGKVFFADVNPKWNLKMSFLLVSISTNVYLLIVYFSYIILYSISYGVCLHIIYNF